MAGVRFGFTLIGRRRADKQRRDLPDRPEVVEAKDSRIRIYKQSVWAVAAAWRLAARTPTRRASA